MSTIHHRIGCRSAEPLIMEGLYAQTLASWRRCLVELDGPGERFAIDLTLGTWRGHTSARQLFVQLGIVFPDSAPMPDSRRGGWEKLPGYASTIARLIDEEARGDRIVSAALEMAEVALHALVSRGFASLSVFLPLSPRAIAREDQWFLGFLARGLSRQPGRFHLVAADAKSLLLPDTWTVTWRQSSQICAAKQDFGLLGLVPGIVDRLTCELLGTGAHDGAQTEALPGDSLLICPSARRVLDGRIALQCDALADLARGVPWLRAFALAHGNPMFADTYELMDHAWSRFLEGGHDLALWMAEFALANAKHAEQHAYALALVQTLRIALMRFHLAAAVDDPSGNLPSSLRGFLHQCKAWGLTWVNQAEQAEPHFELARELLGDDTDSVEYLYLLNISALNRLKLGDLDGAMGFEQVISLGIECGKVSDWHIKYINWLNRARLQRRIGEFHSSREFYRLAFSTCDGLRSESDLIYRNVCLARVHQDMDAYEESLSAWIRASLHFVSASCPEALAPRVAGAILRRTPDDDESRVEMLADSLHMELSQARARIGPSSPAFALNRPSYAGRTFVRRERVPNLTESAHGFGAPGWSVIALPTLVDGEFTGACFAALVTDLYALLAEQCPALDRFGPRTMIVDDCLGHEVATTLEDLSMVCLRLGVRAMSWRTGELDLNALQQDEQFGRLVVELAPGVASVSLGPAKAVWVHYKRYRKSVQWRGPFADLIEKIVSSVAGTRVADLATQSDRIPVISKELRELEEARVVCFTGVVKLKPTAEEFDN